MAYQKIQSKGAYSEFQIKPDEIVEPPHPVTRVEGGGWQLCLINTTNQNFAFASQRYQHADYGPWFRIPVVKNNCPTGYDECFDKEVWTVILTLPDGNQPFSIRIATRPNDFGVAQGTEFLDIRPEPGTLGGVLGTAIDG